MILEPERVFPLKPGSPVPGEHVLYWMQHAQRARENPALEHAAWEAARLRLPLVVLFVLSSFPSATVVHYRFLLKGLAQTAGAIEDRGALFVLRRGDPPKVASELSRAASLAICDAGWTRPEAAWRRAFADASACPVLRVDGEAVVPVESASGKLEWSAFTLRRKVEGAVTAYTSRVPPTVDLPRDARGLDIESRKDLLDFGEGPVSPEYPGDRIPEQVSLPPPGTSAAKARFEAFLENSLDSYDGDRNDPNLAGTSGMSPYLHFGQISPVFLAREVLKQGGPGAAPFIEQLVVRRELSMNLVRY
ncbi:MAG: deoxyribodipyrimidine photolyase, partial [Treponema sp.]|nr:deoxyribodipyrimidine photolyase [Treponema sp.]